MVTPGTVYDYHVASGTLTTLKVQEIPSGYDAAHYATERLTIAARDGTEVPVSIVYPRGFPRDGSRPLFLSAYVARSEEHTSELQSLMRISSAVFCLKKKSTLTSKKKSQHHTHKP